MPAHLVERVLVGRAVPLVRHADEHAGVAAAEPRRVDPGSLDRFPRGLQQHPLLRVHRQCLARGQREELGVEFGGTVQRAAERAEALAPAPVGREPRDSVPTGVDQVPQVFGRGDTTGKAARHGHHRDRFAFRRLQLGQPLPGAPQVARGPPEVGNKFFLGVLRRTRGSANGGFRAVIHAGPSSSWTGCQSPRGSTPSR